jgi:hypothetical protein
MADGSRGCEHNQQRRDHTCRDYVTANGYGMTELSGAVKMDKITGLGLVLGDVGEAVE